RHTRLVSDWSSDVCSSDLSAQSTPLDFNNRRLTYAVSDFDRTHVILGNVTYELPFGAGKRFGGGAGRVMDRLIGGWEVNAIVTQIGRASCREKVEVTEVAR